MASCIFLVTRSVIARDFFLELDISLAIAEDDAAIAGAPPFEHPLFKFPDPPFPDAHEHVFLLFEAGGLPEVTSGTLLDLHLPGLHFLKVGHMSYVLCLSQGLRLLTNEVAPSPLERSQP